MVSPKKTIEGAIGGVLTGVLTAMGCQALFLRDGMGLAEAAVLGLVIAVVSQFSDLAESLLKRDVGVKDSANLLPGHGGMLDRFDSFLFTAPLFYYYLTIFKGS
jgi:phosphatidate cytidylyltransferase